MNVTNMIVFAPIIHKGIRFVSCGPGWALFLPSSQRFWWKTPSPALSLGEVVRASTSTKNPEGESFRVEWAGMNTPSEIGRLKAGIPELV